MIELHNLCVVDNHVIDLYFIGLLSHWFWTVDMVCILLTFLGLALGFSLSALVYELVLYVLMLSCSAINQEAFQILGISIFAICSVKILLLLI